MMAKMAARVLLVLSIAIALPATAQSPTYADGLAAYHRGDYAEAEATLRAVAEADEKSPVTIKAAYFLARALMKQKKFEEAATLFIQIHRTSPAFYREWSCDYLLGVSREATGRG